MSNTRQTKRQQERVRTLALDLMHRAIEISHTTQHDVIFDYAGHVDQVSMHFYVGGYNKDKSVDIGYVYLDDPIKDITDFFKLANTELDKLVATDKAA